MPTFGLIGKKLGHSFSKKYFTGKFAQEGLSNHHYELFEIEKIGEVQEIIADVVDLKGLNVTIPYKQEIIPFLDDMDKASKEIGAVNTIRVSNGILKGYNTDAYGFERSLKETENYNNIKGALILGTGGASKAVEYVLRKNNIPFYIISRSNGDLTYKTLEADPTYLIDNNLIINTTPLGMYPEVENLAPLPYDAINKNHILFDLVYNPEVTAFLREGLVRGAAVKNGLDMLYYQADQAWKIWNEE